MLGGSGSTAGMILGAFIVGVAANGLNLLKVPYFYQTITKGILLIIAVFDEDDPAPWPGGGGEHGQRHVLVAAVSVPREAVLVAIRGLRQAVPRDPRSQRSELRHPQEHGPLHHRGERFRQVDHDQDPHRSAGKHRRERSCSKVRLTSRRPSGR